MDWSLAGGLWANVPRVWKNIDTVQLNPHRIGMMFLPTHEELHFLSWNLQVHRNETGPGPASAHNMKVPPLGSSAPLHLPPDDTLDSFKTICSYLSCTDKTGAILQGISLSLVEVRKIFIELNNWLG